MSNPIDGRKKELRRAVRARMKAISPEERHERSVQACERIVALEAFAQAQTVMLYMPLPDEVDVTSIAVRCFQLGQNVCVPRVNWERKEMRPVSVRTFDDRIMDVDEHGLRTPREGDLVIPSTVDLVVIPGIAFDVRGHRLGRGGGYYDRFLKRLRRGAVKVAAAFDEQIVDEVPTLEHDVLVDAVVTDRRTCLVRRPAVRR